MAWVDITKPNGGDTTEKSFADAVVDDLTFLRGLAGSTSLAAGANGSFENDTDSDGYPDSWVYAPLNNGTGAIDTTDSSHGGKSFKFVRSLGVGNSGGTLTNDDFFEVSPNRILVCQWQMKSSVANCRIKVQFDWYTRAFAAISTTEIYNDNATNPTSWAIRFGSATPPATAYYAKLKITGGDTAPNVAATIRFDDLIITPVAFNLKHEFALTASGTYRWIAPMTGIIEIMLYGAGGGGGGSTLGGAGGGGGGGGSSVHALIPVTANTTYTIVVGNGGAGGTSGGTTGTAGGASTITGGYSAGGGSGGVGSAGGGAGGAAGAASGGIVNTDGVAGSNAAGGGVGGNGGRCSAAGWRGGNGTAGIGNNGDSTGAGGGGAGDFSAGGSGKDGGVVIRYKT